MEKKDIDLWFILDYESTYGGRYNNSEVNGGGGGDDDDRKRLVNRSGPK